MPDLIVVRPETDATELALSSWAALVFAGLAGCSTTTVADLAGAAASRNAVQAGLAKCTALYYFGHGLTDSLGQSSALVDRYNVSILSGLVVVAIACHSADTLGPQAVSHGCRAFIGFDDELLVYLPQPSLFAQAFERGLIDFAQSGIDTGDLSGHIIANLQRIESDHRSGTNKNDYDATIIWLAAHINWRGARIHGSTLEKI